MKLSERIKHFRELSGLSQRALGSKLGITGVSVAHWESGVNVPSGKNLIRLADILNVSVEQLTGVASIPTLPAGAKPIAPSGLAYLPFRGTIHAGEPIDVPEQINELLEVPKHIADAHPQGFLLRVAGTCMNNVYPEGCHVVVDPTLEPETGDIGAFLLNGEVVMRRVLKGKNALILTPDSTEDTHEDIIVSGESELVSYGRVVWFQSKEEL